MPEIPEEGEADRVGRRAVDRVGQRAILERPLSYAEWPHQRLLMADRALVRVRGDDRHVTHLVEGLLEGEEAARFDPVIVRDEDARTTRPLRHRPARCAQGARAAASGTAREWFATLLVEVASLAPRSLAGHVRLIGTPLS